MEDVVDLLAYAGLIILALIGWRRWLRDIRGYIQRRQAENVRREQAAVELQAHAGEILAKIEKDHDLTAIPKAFCLLFVSDDPVLRLRATRSITQLIGLLPVTGLERLDSLFRARTLWEGDYGWKKRNPAALLLPSLSETEKAMILGLASFHPNGYFREKAIRALSRFTDGTELPYLIIRLNDWVLAIWNCSHAAVLARLRPQNARAIINSLPLIFRLRDRTRWRRHDLVDASIAILSNPGAHRELELGLRSKDITIRRSCYQAIVEAGIFDNSALLERLFREPSPTNRSLILRQMGARLTPEEFQRYRTGLLRDRSAAVRLTVLRMLHQLDAAKSIPDLEQAVLDKDPAVREAARHLLGKYDNRYDFPRLYREVLLGPPTFGPGAIAGLGETGQADDTKYVIPFLKDDRVRIVRSAMGAMAKLDFSSAKDSLIALLADVMPGIVKEARRLLSGRIDAVDAALIHRDYFQNKPESLRRHAAFLLLGDRRAVAGLGKWDALGYILEICADQSERVARIGRSALSKWLSRYNSVFTTPAQAQLGALQKALKEYRAAIPEETGRLIEFILKGFSEGETGLQKLEAWARPGVVDLRDLARRNAGDRLAISRFLEAARLAPGEPASVSFAPPRVVIAIVPVDDVGLLARSRAWLEDAAHVIVVRARDGPNADSDPVIEETVKSEWRDALAAVSVPIELVDWRQDEDIQAAVGRAVALSKSTAPAPPSVAPPPIVEHPPGPRLAVTCLPPGASLDRLIASHLAASPDRVTLFAGNGATDLSDPTASVCFDDDDATGAMNAKGRRLVADGRDRWRIDDRRFEAFGYMALGFDSHHPVGWTGTRMAAYWLYSGTHGAGFLSAIDHDYPCGPAKKRYGYEDNDPVGVSLAPDLGAVAYRFEHDILLTSAIPIPWRPAGPLLVADFPRDPSRALFFAQRPNHSPTDDLLDDDARDNAPGFVPGPTAEARYALDLKDIVYRITSVKPWAGDIARVGGPEEGFAVFDAAHQEVRLARGRLLDGWWRWATVLDAGAYWREDLATGERRRIAAADTAPLVSVGVPWTKNVVLILGEGERLWVQLM